jgi:hypothetical protein
MEMHDSCYFNQVWFNPKKYSERKRLGQATPDITIDNWEKLGIQLDSVDRILYRSEISPAQADLLGLVPRCRIDHFRLRFWVETDWIHPSDA